MIVVGLLFWCYLISWITHAQGDKVETRLLAVFVAYRLLRVLLVLKQYTCTFGVFACDAKVFKEDLTL